AIFSKCDRIGEQVDENLLGLGRITVPCDVGWALFLHELDSLYSGEGMHHLDNIIYGFSQADRKDVVFDSPSFDAAEIEDVVDDSNQMALTRDATALIFH